MKTIRRFTIIIGVMAVFGLAAFLAASGAGMTASADGDGENGRGQRFIGLWQTIQVNSDGALQTLSISDTDGDGVFQIALHEDFFSLCGGGFGVVGGTAAVDDEGILVGDLTVTCTPGPVVSTSPTWEYIRGHDQLVGWTGDIYHRISGPKSSKSVQPASDDNGWIEVVERQVFFEAETDDGFFELEFEEIVGGDEGTERFLEVCFPHFEGFICNDVEVDEEDMDVDFGFPRTDSTARVAAVVEGCGLVDLNIVLTIPQEYEKFSSKIFSPDGELLRTVKGIEAQSEDTEIGVDVTGVLCGVALSDYDISEASHGMKEEINKERAEEDEEED